MLRDGSEHPSNRILTVDGDDFCLSSILISKTIRNKICNFNDLILNTNLIVFCWVIHSFCIFGLLDLVSMVLVLDLVFRVRLGKTMNSKYVSKSLGMLIQKSRNAYTKVSDSVTIVSETFV